jgi:hypothetical protein
MKNIKREVELSIRTIEAEKESRSKKGFILDPTQCAMLEYNKKLLAMVEKEEEEQKYNGWANYETWNCKLWLDNDEGTYHYMHEEAKRIYEEAEKTEYNTKRESAIYNLSEFLKEYMEENNPIIDSASMYTDILGAALRVINYYEIAKHYIDDIEE